MKKKYLKATLPNLLSLKQEFYFLFVIFILFPFYASSQTTLVAELSGTPLDTTGWTVVDADINGDEIVLTEDIITQAGAIFYEQPYNLNECINWKVEFDYKLTGAGNYADGLAFWYLENPPTDFIGGGGIGMPSDARGLKVCIDTYDNDSSQTNNPELQIYYGEGYDENQSIFPNLVLRQYDPALRTQNFQHCIITWSDGFITVEVDGNEIISGTPIAHDGVENINEGYFGFSASTGAIADRQSLKNVKVFVDSVVLDASTAQIEECDTDGDGFAQFDLVSVGDDLISVPSTYTFYHTEDDAFNDVNAIPSAYVNSYVNAVQGSDEQLYVKVSNGFACPAYAQVDLRLKSVPVNTSTVNLAACDDDGDGAEQFNIEATLPQFVNNPADYEISYYDSRIGAINEDTTAEILNTTDFSLDVSQTSTAYIKIYDATQDCYRIVKVIMTTDNSPEIASISDLIKCDMESSNYVFDLTENTPNILGSQDASAFTVNYFETQADADVPQNEIQDPENYQSLNNPQTIYVRIENNQTPECYKTTSFVIESVQNKIVSLENGLSECSDGKSAIFDLTTASNTIQLGAGEEIDGYYTSKTNAISNVQAIINPSAYDNIENVEVVYVKVKNDLGDACFTLYTIQLETRDCVFEIPKGFSPNGDTVNEDFEIPNLYKGFPEFNMQIFSRYGRRVYEGNVNKSPWNGDSEDGNKLPTGTYFYRLSLNDGKSEVIEGWVYLNR